MKINRFAVSLGVVAVAAFLAGRMDFSFNNHAIAQDHKHDHDHGHGHSHDHGPQMTPEMEQQMNEWMEAMHEAGEPGEHHEVLDRLVGTWEGTYSWTMAPDMPPMEMQGRAEREWILGGRYVKETVTSSFMGQEFKGIGFIGYNNTTGEYEFVWMDSHSTGIYKETGSFDSKSQTMLTFARHMNPMTGKVMHTHNKLILSKSDQQIMHGNATGPDGEWYTMFTGNFRRVD